VSSRSVSLKPGVSIRCTSYLSIRVVAIWTSFVPRYRSQQNPQAIITYLQDFRSSPISMSSSPVIFLIKVVFPAPVMPMTAIRMDLSVKFGRGIFNFGVQRWLKKLLPCSEEEGGCPY
jgi:hypothetical protein